MVDNLQSRENIQLREQKVLFILGSKRDVEHAEKVAGVLNEFNIKYEGYVNSAHRNLPRLIQEIDKRLENYDSNRQEVVIITIAGLADALSGVVKGYIRYKNMPIDVVACPPPNPEFGNNNYWSDLLMPSGMALPVFLNPKNGAFYAIEQFSKNNPELANRYAKAKTEERLSPDATYTFNSPKS
jgi:5-(carboxyamino)imidazole ribonucleotide mutase